MQKVDVDLCDFSDFLRFLTVKNSKISPESNEIPQDLFEIGGICMFCVHFTTLKDNFDSCFQFRLRTGSSVLCTSSYTM